MFIYLFLQRAWLLGYALPYVGCKAEIVPFVTSSCVLKPDMPTSTDLPRVFYASFRTSLQVSHTLDGGSSGLEALTVFVERYFRLW